MSDRDYHCWATATARTVVAAILLAWLGLCGAAPARPPQVLPAPQSLPAPVRADGEPHPDGGGWRWSAAWGCWYRVRPAHEAALVPWPAPFPARVAAPVVLPRGGTNCPT